MRSSQQTYATEDFHVETTNALLVETVGKWYRVRLDGGGEQTIKAIARVVVGDRVLVKDNLIVGHAPRTTSLCRTGNAGFRVMCANTDLLVGVFAATNPPFRAGLVDRLMVAASVGGMDFLLVINKCDEGVSEELEEELRGYLALGVEVRLVSAMDGDEVPELLARLQGHDAVLAGHSGVGKSSLIERLLPGVSRQIGGLDPWGRGRHTTSTTCRFDLPGTGSLIDLPGVRELGIGYIPREELKHHFQELAGLQCRYRDCLHNGEEGCKAEEVCTPERLDSYQKLLEEVV